MTPTGRLDLANNMRIFKGRYFNINRRLLMGFGLWPYEMKVKKIILRVIIMGLLTIFTIPQVISMYLHYENLDRLMLNVNAGTGLLVMNLKVLGMILAEKNMKALHKSIANNWQQIQGYCERDILHRYAERARTATIGYIALIMSAAVIGSTLPLGVKFLDFIRPLENPRPNMYVVAGEFFVDRETHFLLISFADYVADLLLVIVIIVIDTMYIVSVEHCCSLYAVIRYRLLELRARVRNSSSATEGVDSYEWLRDTIQLHQNALTFTSLLRDSYSTTFLFVAFAALYIIPMESCAIIANLDSPLHLIPYALCLVAIMTGGFFICYPAQRIIDHQLSLLDAAYCNEWYAVPLRTKKLLLIFMLRCSAPVTITAGNLLEANLEVYFMIMKTTLSYITVAASFR